MSARSYKSKAQNIRVLGFVVAGGVLLVTSYFLWGKQFLSSRAAATCTASSQTSAAILTTCNNDIKSLLYSYQSGSTAQKSQVLPKIQTLAVTRTNALKSAIDSDPKLFLTYATFATDPLLGKIITQLPVATQSLFEYKLTVSGKLNVVHIDEPKGGLSYVYTLTNSASPTQMFLVHFNDVPKLKQLRGVSLQVNKTIGLQKDLVIGKGQYNLTYSSPGGTKAHAPIGPQKVVFIKFKLPGDTQMPYTNSQLKSIFLDRSNTSSAASYVSELSFGRITYPDPNSSNVFFPSDDSYYLVNDTQPGYCWTSPFFEYGPTTWDYQAIQKAVANGAVLDANTILVYIMPFRPACGSNGGAASNADRGKLPSPVAFYNGTVWPRAAKHELGHTLGLDHASMTSVCSTYPECSVVGTNEEYGDQYDIMGLEDFQYNAPHKYLLGLFDSSQVQTVATDGLYRISLHPLETNEAGIHVIRVLRATPFYYYVELRRPVGYDNWRKKNISGTPDIFDGVLIHMWDGSTTNNYIGDNTKLLDSTAGTSPQLVSWKPGQVFTDATNKVKIRLDTPNPEFAGSSVNVTVCKGEPAYTNCIAPTPTVGPSPRPCSPAGGICGTGFSGKPLGTCCTNLQCINSTNPDQGGVCR